MNHVPAFIDGSLTPGTRSRFGPGRLGCDDRSTGACDVRLSMPALAENVALVRHVVGAVAEAVRLSPQAVENVKLAVTEACTNVVRHAYAGDEGPLHVAAEPDGGWLTVVVSDRGNGLRQSPDRDGPGLGLPLIAALADTLEIGPGPQRGSVLRMSFRPGAGVDSGGQ